jgi:hypothetical protein
MLVGRSPLIPLEHAVSLHRKVDQPGQPDVDINPIYVQEAGHEVPRHTMPRRGMLPATALQVVRDELILTSTAVMRIVVRNGFSRDLADVFLADLRRDSRALAAHPQAHTPLAPEPFRQGFAH